MSFASRNNKTGFTYDFETTGFEYKKCKDLKPNTIYKVFGYFSVSGMYGKCYNLVTDKFYLNLPKHMTEQVEKFTDEDIEDIKSGKVGFIRQDYTTKTGKQCSSIQWVDC